MTDDDGFSAWMAAHAGVRDARIGARLGGGNSNITHLIESAEGPLIFRRAPATATASAAAGIKREFTILQAIEGLLPAPRPIALCEDPSVAGAPFAVTAFVAGVVVSTDLPGAYAATPDTVRQIGEQMIDALSALHRIGWHTPTLAPLHRPGAYVERQVVRWMEIRARESVRELPLLFDLGKWLIDNQPPNPPVSIIHGDFHLENALFGAQEPALAAVIDWELATIGDPTTDLGLFLMFWGPRSKDPPAFDWVQQSTRIAGVVPAQSLAERWARATGLSIDRLAYYRCFAFWRLAAVVEGAYVAFRRGQLDTPFARRLERDVPGLLAEAAAQAAD